MPHCIILAFILVFCALNLQYKCEIILVRNHVNGYVLVYFPNVFTVTRKQEIITTKIMQYGYTLITMSCTNILVLGILKYFIKHYVFSFSPQKLPE